MKFLRKIKNYSLSINNTGGQINLILALLTAVSFSFFITKLNLFKSPQWALAFIAVPLIALITFLNTDFALIILIFAMLLSPELPIAKLPERAVVIRLDDILLVVMFFSWLAKAAMNKELGLLRRTPINRPLAIYVTLCVVVTAFMIFFRIGQAKFTTASFYIFKYIEYLMLFFLVANNLKSIRQYKLFTFFILLTCFIVCAYGYIQMQKGIPRISTPFEGKQAEPNTLAGYFIIMLGLIGGLFLYSDSLKKKILLGGLFLFIIPVFLFTLSRSGYVAFIIMCLAFIVFSKKKRVFLISLIMLVMLILPFTMPSEIITRIRKTFVGNTKYQVLGKNVALEGSAAARVNIWKYLAKDVSRSPLFGYGVTGIYFVDTQYGLVLGELGIVGLAVFCWLIYRIFKNSFKVYRQSRDDYIEGLSLGFLAGLIGILVMGWAANIFIIVRIMEPFWFIAAMVLVAPQLELV